MIAFIKAGIDGKALITSCVTSVPCSLAVSKLRYPETEQSLSKGEIFNSVQERKKKKLTIISKEMYRFQKRRMKKRIYCMQGVMEQRKGCI